MSSDFLSSPVPVYLAAIGYLWVAVACTLWGIELVWYSTRMPCKHALWTPERLFTQHLYRVRVIRHFVQGIHKTLCRLKTFELWLGLFLIFGDGALYGILSQLFSEDRGDVVPVWAFVVLMVGAITASGAYLTWPTE